MFLGVGKVTESAGVVGLFPKDHEEIGSEQRERIGLASDDFVILVGVFTISLVRLGDSYPSLNPILDFLAGEE